MSWALISRPASGPAKISAVRDPVVRREVVVGGDMSMPYLGAPFLAEGSAAGLTPILDLGLLSHPGAADLAGLRRGVLHRLAGREHLINPFKFANDAGLLDLELPAPG